VIDANSLIFQVFHAIPEMTSPRGQPVNAVFGFTRDLLFLLQDKKPDYLFCAFDLAGPTFRHELYDQYKAERAEMPDDLAPQFDLIHRMVEALRIPILSLESFEADDILATVARRTEEMGGQCFVVTADKDCRQLITDCVKIYNVRKNTIFDAEALAAEWGVRPDQVVDFQALVGDPVDNVPGVPLIGPKNARELLEKYGTLESVFEHAHEISGAKRRQNLIEGRDKAMLSRQLVRLDSEVPIEIDWNHGHVESFDVHAALELCGEFGFHRLADQIRTLGAGPVQPAVEPVQVKADYRLIDTPEKFAAFLAELSRQERFSFDTETTSTSPTQADIVGYSFSWLPGQGYYVPVRGPEGEAKLDPATVLETLRPILENPTIGKLGQNLKYDMLVLRRAGVELRGLAFDTMVASYLIDAGERNHNLDELALRYLNHTTIKITELIGTGKDQKRMDEAPIAAVSDYAAEDAEVVWRLWPMLEKELKDANLEPLFEKVELPLIDVLVEMEHNGIKIDVDRLADLSRQYQERLTKLEAEIYELAGRPFNIDSPKQLQQVLFVEQKLPVVSKTKTKGEPSTDVSVLEELALQHALPAKIIEYRQYAKLKGTYVDALPKMVNPRTGRVHASFQQAVAATGRLSSSDPNLQNIPIRSESGREIRSAFLAGHSGWQLLAADYSQIELRVLAHYSEDETLCQAFAADEDIHTLVASQVYGVPQAEVTSAMRRAAKTVNFGIIYGQSPFGLAKVLGIEQSQAAEFINAYFKRYPGVERFLSSVLEDCLRKGYVSTILGRRRAIHGVRPGAGRQRNLSERTAINTVIQGSAADLIKLAMIGVFNRLRREGLAARLLLQIHDELVFEVPPDEVALLAQLVAEEMAGVMALRVPLKVDVKTGYNWAETEPWS
jgi:DNA polymerase-1